MRRRALVRVAVVVVLMVVMSSRCDGPRAGTTDVGRHLVAASANGMG
jgi:hypothetical protein